MALESAALAVRRWQELAVVQELYADFVPFLHVVMELLGFDTTDIQEDIAKFIAYGPAYLMVMAQRGQAKTTICAAYAVWCLIHDPRHRILIISAGGAQASDISTLVIRIVMTLPELECMRPDTSNGDRSSVEHFDVHHSLKGVDKSPSVACIGITGQLPGKRADLLIADDVESPKNASTAVQRAQLLQLTLEFTSINSTGRIVWLGTPQTTDSIYNTLPSRGVTVRIWPGRYPTPEQVANYEAHLAPLLVRRLAADPSLSTGGGLLGDQGKPIDPVLMSEASLQKKELDQGTSHFQLQFMLNTRLVDALRYPLKPQHCVIMDVQKRMPLEVVRGVSSGTLTDYRVHDFAFRAQGVMDMSPETANMTGIVAYVDPAGGGINADETAYAITGFLNGTIYVLDVGGLPGGYSQDVMKELAQRIALWAPEKVIIEKNMGYGAFKEVFTPILQREFKCAIDDDYVSGQKELRIIATLEPVMGRGALVINRAVVERDAADCQRYAPAMRCSYSLFFQMAKITKERGALYHDDRLDALEGAVRYWQKVVAIDQAKTVERQRAREHEERIKNVMGYNNYDLPTGRKGSVLNRLKRK
jgi:hypothetical protein